MILALYYYQLVIFNVLLIYYRIFAYDNDQMVYTCALIDEIKTLFKITGKIGIEFCLYLILSFIFLNLYLYYVQKNIPNEFFSFQLYH